MNHTENWLVHDHTDHEDLLSRCQEAVEVEDWESAQSLYRELQAELKWHITQEEQVVYPAYEAETGEVDGPTAALRLEHTKITNFMRDLGQVFPGRDSEHVLDCLYRLEQLMVKHHEKEEDIFLPMAGLILKDRREEVQQQLNTFDASKPGNERED